MLQDLELHDGIERTLMVRTQTSIPISFLFLPLLGCGGRVATQCGMLVLIATVVACCAQAPNFRSALKDALRAVKEVRTSFNS
jgi:hypothetical protein